MQAQESSTAGRDRTVGKSELYKSRHTSEFTELHCNQRVWMEHHITGKWNTKVTVRRKGTDGNSYIVCASDGNTYIRGRRLLKPINSNNYLKEDGDKPQIQEPEDSEPTTPKKKDNPKRKMPRRSPRNHNSTRIKMLHIYEVENGWEEIKNKEGMGGPPKSEYRQFDHNQHKLRIPPLRIPWPNCLEHRGTRILLLEWCSYTGT